MPSVDTLAPMSQLFEPLELAVLPSASAAGAASAPSTIEPHSIPLIKLALIKLSLINLGLGKRAAANRDCMDGPF